MPKLERNKLRQELIAVYYAYAKGPTDMHVKKTARKLHQDYGNVGPSVDKYMAVAVSFLANIGWETIQPKPTREQAEKLVFALATRKA